jgi:glyoxylase-like metal-dependent hydrolase (beta-lactamase superfamily II)
METEMTQPVIRAFFDEPTFTVSYLVWDPATRRGAVIDPVLDFDLASGEADVRSAEAILAAAREEGVGVDWVLETHAHADHLSAAPFIKAETGAKIAIGEHIREVQKIFRPVFAADDLKADGSDFDRLIADGETLPLGELTVEALHVPGHTPADLAYRIGEAVFVGEAAIPVAGCARFGGSIQRHDAAEQLRVQLRGQPDVRRQAHFAHANAFRQVGGLETIHERAAFDRELVQGLFDQGVRLDQARLHR